MKPSRKAGKAARTWSMGKAIMVPIIYRRVPFAHAGKRTFWSGIQTIL
jgi:hypothetical protein